MSRKSQLSKMSIVKNFNLNLPNMIRKHFSNFVFGNLYSVNFLNVNCDFSKSIRKVKFFFYETVWISIIYSWPSFTFFFVLKSYKENNADLRLFYVKNTFFGIYISLTKAWGYIFKTYRSSNLKSELEIYIRFVNINSIVNNNFTKFWILTLNSKKIW